MEKQFSDMESVKKAIEDLGFSLGELRKMHPSNKEFAFFAWKVVQQYHDNPKMLDQIAGLIIKNKKRYTKEDLMEKAKGYKNEDRIQAYHGGEYGEKWYKNCGYGLANGELVEDLLKIDANDKKAVIKFFLERKIPYKKVADLSGYIINRFKNGDIDDYRKKLVDYKKKLLIYRDFLKEQRANMREDNHQKRDMQIAKEAWELYDIIMSRDDLFSLGDVAKALEREDIVLKSNDSLAKVRENGQKRNFDDRIFKYYLPIWRQDEKKLAKMKAKLQQNHQMFLNDIQQLLPLVTTEIKVGDMTRNFDIIDCYTYFQENLPHIYDTLLTFFKDKKDDPNNQAGILKAILYKFTIERKRYNNKDFFGVSEKVEEEFIERIKNKKVVIDGPNGFQYVLTKENKDAVFEFLRKYNIPIEANTFNFAIYHLNINTFEMEGITKDNYLNYMTQSDVKKR